MARLIWVLFSVVLLCTSPALAQTTETYSAYVYGLPAVNSLSGTEKIFVLQNNQPGTTTPQQIVAGAGTQIFSSMTGDCSSASPPSVVCGKTNGVAFAPSATTDTTDASNISSGVLAAARGGTGDDGGAWTVYNPTVTEASGVYNATGRFKTIGKVTFVTVTVTCIGSGSVLTVSLPNTASSASNYYLSGREQARTGVMWSGEVVGNTVEMFNYANDATMSVGDTVVLTGVYENQ